MRRSLVLLPALALAAACESTTPLTAPAAPHAGRAVATDSIVTPGQNSPVQFATLTGAIDAPDCLPEPVVFTGTVQMVFKTDVGTNGQPRMVGNSHLQGGTAVGAITGATYRVVNVSNSTSTDFFAFDAASTSTGTFRVITPGGGADYATHYTQVFHMDANGNITARFSDFNASCGGPTVHY